MLSVFVDERVISLVDVWVSGADFYWIYVAIG